MQVWRHHEQFVAKIKEERPTVDCSIQLNIINSQALRACKDVFCVAELNCVLA